MSQWEHEKSAHERGYGWAWKKIRQMILARDNYMCVPCLDKDRLTPATEVDHILSKAKGGDDDPDNLQSICADCHTAKTTKENGANPDKGSDTTGQPIDPGHPWNE